MAVYHNRWFSDKRLLFTFVECDLAQILDRGCSFSELSTASVTHRKKADTVLKQTVILRIFFRTRENSRCVYVKISIIRACFFLVL